MEGDGGKLPGDFQPFRRSRRRLNAICCFSFALMRGKKDFCFLVRCEASLGALSLPASLLLAVILLILFYHTEMILRDRESEEGAAEPWSPL